MLLERRRSPSTSRWALTSTLGRCPSTRLYEVRNSKDRAYPDQATDQSGQLAACWALDQWDGRIGPAGRYYPDTRINHMDAVNRRMNDPPEHDYKFAIMLSPTPWMNIRYFQGPEPNLFMLSVLQQEGELAGG